MKECFLIHINRPERITSFMSQGTSREKNTGTVYAVLGVEYETNHLRPVSAEYIPIPVINGYGEVTLTSCPEQSTYLELNLCECTTIYTVTSDYIDIVSVDEENGIVSIADSAKNRNDSVGVTSVGINGTLYEVTEITRDGSFILFHLNKNVMYDEKQGNQLRLYRQ